MKRKSIYTFFWKLVGEDQQILRNVTRGIQNRFAFSGLLFLIFFVSGMISYHHTFSQIFNIPYLSWLLGLLFSLMIFNIYKLNLITISVTQRKKGFGFVFSLFCRVCFLLLLGLTIIKPLETIILKKTLEIELAYLKLKDIKEVTVKTMNHFNKVIELNEIEIKRLNEQINHGRVEINTNTLHEFEVKKQKLINDRNSLIIETEKRIDNSPYFVKSLLLLNYKFPWVWYISSGFLFIFLLPLFLKYFLSSSNNYSLSRFKITRKIILDEHAELIKLYPLIFQKKIGKRIELQELYEDPPFNLIRKKVTLNTGDEDNFLNHLNGL